MPGSRGRCAEGPGRPRTHPVLALGVHEARLEHVQGLAQECGASALWRGGGGGQLQLAEQTRPLATGVARVTGERARPAA